MDGMADPSLDPSLMKEAAATPMEYPGMMVEQLYKFWMSTLPGEKALSFEKNHTL